MKYRRYLTVLAVFLSAACAKEEITEETKPSLPEDAVLFSGTMAAHGDAGTAPGTRTSYEDNGESIVVEWAEKDGIGIFCEAGGAVTASNVGYVNGTAGPTASFTPLSADNVIRWEEGTSYDFYAYYPYAAGETASAEAVPVSLPAEQTFDPADPQGQFSSLDFMYAENTGIDFTGGEWADQHVQLAFSHLFTVVEVRLSTTLPVTVDKIIFSCDDASAAVSLGEGSTVNLKTGEVTPADASGSVALSGSQRTVPGSTAVWQMFINPGHEGKTFTVKAVINGNEYTVVESKAAPEGGFLAGETYSMTKEGLEVNESDVTAVDLSAGGTANTYIVSMPATLYTFDATVKGNGVERSFTWSETDGTQITRGYTAADLEIAPASVGLVWYNTPMTADGYVNESPVTVESVGYDPETGLASFTTPAEFVTGNALLAAYDEAGTILWSWNIWAVEGYDPDATAKALDGITMMDRNLGAAAGPEVMGSSDSREAAWAIGNYYQWGRKDPFPAMAEYGETSKTGVVAVSGSSTGSWGLPSHTPIDELKSANQTLDFTDLIFGTDAAANCRQLSTELPSGFTVEDGVAESVKYPYRWMSWSGSDGAGGSYLWMVDYNNTGLGTEAKNAWRYLWGNPDVDPEWNASDNVKTVYDPCPPGWKVMPKIAWDLVYDSGIQTLSNGYYSPAYDLYFPFTGQRQAGYGGSLIQTQEIQYLHTCNVCATAQWEVISDMLTNQYTYTAAGHNVRCVKDEVISVPEPEPEPEASTYLLRGHVFGWGNADGPGLTMYVDGDFVSAKDIDRESLIAENIGTQGFKVFNSATYTWLGVIDSTVIPGQPVEMSVSGANGTLDTGSAASEKYDVYFRPGDNILYVMEAGQVPPEE